MGAGLPVALLMALMVITAQQQYCPQCLAPPKAALIIVIMYCCPCSPYYPHLGASALAIPAPGHGFVQLVLLCFLKKTFPLPLPRCNSLAIVIHAQIYQLGLYLVSVCERQHSCFEHGSDAARPDITYLEGNSGHGWTVFWGHARHRPRHIELI